MITGGGATTVKLVLLDTVPLPPTTERAPVVAAFGTVATIKVDDQMWNEALKPLNATFLTLLKLVPAIETDAPGCPFDGANDVIVGGAAAWETSR